MRAPTAERTARRPVASLGRINEHVTVAEAERAGCARGAGCATFGLWHSLEKDESVFADDCCIFSDSVLGHRESEAAISARDGAGRRGSAAAQFVVLGAPAALMVPPGIIVTAEVRRIDPCPARHAAV